jgi:Ca-activated chloride channel family protein
MISFYWPWLLATLPLPLLVYWLPAKQRTVTAALKMPLIINTNTQVSSQKDNKKSSLIVLSLIWILTVLAASRPQWLGEPIDIPTQGREMMIAVDLSGSMQIEDMRLNGHTVNRLTMLKSVLGKFIEHRKGDRLGLILFADDAYMQTPMTYDRKTVKQMLDEAVLGLVGQKTAIGDAIALAAKRFDAKKKTNKVLLLLTDGQNTAGKITPDQALELAVDKGITIYTIGIGADEMLQRTLFGMRRVNPSSDLDEAMLTKLAEKTHGKYFRARDGKSMAEIYQLLDKLEPIEQNQQQMRPLTALFYWPLSAAFIIALLYLMYLSLPQQFKARKESNSSNNTLFKEQIND